MGTLVFTAMSGGVDSSVASWLLLRQGYQCAGGTMRLFDETETAVGQIHPDTEPRRDGAPEDTPYPDSISDAQTVASQLGIPHTVLDLRARFDRAVVRPFADAYARGDTPNPCAICNRYLKFGDLLQEALSGGAQYLATGHYARICWTPSTRRWAVRKGRDPRRDQSYFLSLLSQDQLSHILFPLGDFTKEEVRRIAAEQGLVSARRRDSQDVCFIPDGDYAAFLERYTGTPDQPGAILDLSGRVIGQHRGAVRYTLGQRKGLGVSAPEPLYVCGKNMEENTVTLGPEAALFRRSLIAKDMVWGAAASLAGPLRVKAKVRYRQQEQSATAEPMDGGRVRVTFDVPQRAITPGQIAVLYDGDTVLGGGVIASVEEE